MKYKHKPSSKVSERSAEAVWWANKWFERDTLAFYNQILSKVHVIIEGEANPLYEQKPICLKWNHIFMIIFRHYFEEDLMCLR